MTESERLRAAARLLRLARELNALRPPDHRERISRAVAETREYFRTGPEAALPAPRQDLLLDRIEALASGCEASPEGFARICDDLQEIVDLRQRAVS